MKQFVIIGCGRFGSSIAKTLHKAGYDVLAIDKDEDKIQDIKDHVTHAVQIDATDELLLNSLGIRNFDVAVVAIGSDIQSSILIALLVKEMGIKFVVAKALDELQGKVLKKIGADKIIYPERDMGVRVAYNLMSSNILNNIEFAEEYNVLEINPLINWIGKSLGELNLRKKYGINVLVIKSGNEINSSPSNEDVVLNGDVMVVLGHKDKLRKLDLVN